MSEFLTHLPEFIGHHAFLVMAFVVVLLALIGGEVSRLMRGYKELTPAGLTLLINRENALVVDLSSMQDYEKGHIAGARHVAMSQFDPENKELAKVKDLPIAVYCKTGTTSAQAATRLVKAGFKHVYWLGGGLAAWQQADLPTTRGK
ncbi:MAG TPA: rhodanese-like domain-containing protein [Rudaea sp.]|nr:rhodanese-like domain-containing protein [Rudaea sp.]